MTTGAKLAAVVIAFALFGCKSPLSPATASAADGSNGASSGEGAVAALFGSTQVQYIADPSMDNMNAYAITIPAQWRFDGIMLSSGACTGGASAVFRATSPDGLEKVERMPTMGWAWGTGPAADHKENSCLPLSGPISAQDYLKFLAATMHLEYLGDEQVPAESLAAVQAQQQEAERYYGRNSGPVPQMELARAKVRSHNGSATALGELRGSLNCSEMNWPGMRSGVRGVPDRAPSTTHHCSAGVTYISAPESQFARLVNAWDSQKMGGKPVDAWKTAWVQRNKQQTQEIVAGMAARSEASLAAQRQQFAHSQAVQQQMHEEFLNTLQRGTDKSMQGAWDSMNSRGTQTSDWVDYSLDRQTVMDPNTGRIGKISNQSTIGGSMQKVHGDGTPY